MKRKARIEELKREMKFKKYYRSAVDKAHYDRLVEEFKELTNGANMVLIIGCCVVAMSSCCNA